MLGFEDRLQVTLFGRVGADLLTPVGIAISIVVTVHVLLHKREVGPSIGWMGLAWLSPFIGGLLYLLFGVNRVSRRARELRGRRRHAERATAGAAMEAGVRDLAPLSHAAGRITERPLLAGNAVAGAAERRRGLSGHVAGDRRGAPQRRAVELHPARRSRRAGASSTR